MCEYFIFDVDCTIIFYLIKNTTVSYAGAAVSDVASDFIVELDRTLTPEDIRRAQIIYRDDHVSSPTGICSETSSIAAHSTDSLTQQLGMLRNLQSFV